MWLPIQDDIATLVGEKILNLNSSGGGAETLTLVAATANAGASQACRSTLIWTTAADVYFKIGSTDAAATDALLPADTIIPIPVNNTNLLQFYSVAGGTAYIVWRS